jgi:hypothetical protein
MAEKGRIMYEAYHMFVYFCAFCVCVCVEDLYALFDQYQPTL